MKTIFTDDSCKLLKDIYKQAVFVEEFFKSNPTIVTAVTQQAFQLKNAILQVDTFIESLTQVVCPHCLNVCCKNRHGYYELADIVYLKALKMPLPKYQTDAKDDDVCQFLSRSGCTLKRHQRPFRCNWHFCEALIAHMQIISQKKVRAFSDIFSQALNARRRMMQVLEPLLNPQG